MNRKFSLLWKKTGSAIVGLVAIGLFDGSIADRALAVCAPANCIGTYATTGVYDEQTVSTNAVDAIAAGTNVGTTGLVSAGATGLSVMAPDFQTAFVNNIGGVVNFDTVQDAHELTTFNQFDAAFGADLNFVLTVTRTDGGGGLNTNTNNAVTSGTNYLGIQGAAPFTISFSLPLKEFGITGVSRSDGGTRTDVMTIKYTDSTTYVFPSETITGGAGVDDTFFGHVAPAGKKIASMSWGGTTGFARWDDFAFVAADFQPGDVDGDLDVDLTDYGIIRDHLGQTGASLGIGDLTGDTIVNLADFEQWKKFYPHPGAGAGGAIGGTGVVPEPSSLVLMLAGIAGAIAATRGRKSSDNLFAVE